MSKILVVADIHINDYPNRNPSNRFRLYQGSVTVANNIIKVGKQEGCDIIVFAGDIIEKSIIKPLIQYEVKRFLDTIMQEFKIGYIIFGNHDLDTKSINQDLSDSCLSVMLPDNLHYVHKQVVQIDGISAGFCNWMPEFDLSWINNKVDVLFTHATICYSKNENEGRLFTSQVLDETKFDIAICGDIHKRGQIGKYVSIGCTQRCKLGDPEEASGVVLDTSNKSWKWVDLNPDNNLIKFKTTSKTEEDGWHADEQTWYVHKNEASIIDSATGKIKVNAWSEINNLIEDAVIKSGLQEVHTNILKNISNIDAGEVDFNFTILRLRCENWRSIGSANLNFQDGDRILVQGSNGSGKTSLLSAIKYAFIDCGDTTGLTSLKPFIQFGKKDCFTEVTFLYQENVCRIMRGTKTGTKGFGLWINDEEQKYNNKKAFEDDCRARFPFIEYIDAFFFDADKNSFLKSLSPERITKITSTFLKLNRIDTYNNTARLLYEQIKTQVSDWLSKMKETEKVLNYIQDKINTITLPNSDLKTLMAAKEQGLDIQRRNTAWNNYSTKSANLLARIQQTENQLNDLNISASQQRSISVIDDEINQCNSYIQSLQTSLIELGNIRLKLNYKQQEINSLKTEGNNAYLEAKNIGIGKTCSHCGQVINTTDAMLSHKKELENKVEEIKQKYQTAIAELQILEQQKNNSEEEYTRLNNEISNANSKISLCMSEKNNITSINSSIESNKSLYNSLNSELNKLEKVEKVELPDNFMQVMSNIESGIIAWNLYQTSIQDRESKELEYKNYQNNVIGLQNNMQLLESYIKLTGPTGIIFEEIYNKLCSQFSSPTVKYTVERKGKGYKEHLTLVPLYNNNGNWVNISMCSSGQRIMLDLDYINNLLSSSTGCGLMIFDEFLKALDPDHLEEAIEIIKNMNIGCTLLTCHSESIPTFYNKTAMMSLDNNGLTDIIFR